MSVVHIAIDTAVAGNCLAFYMTRYIQAPCTKCDKHMAMADKLFRTLGNDLFLIDLERTEWSKLDEYRSFATDLDYRIEWCNLLVYTREHKWQNTLDRHMRSGTLDVLQKQQQSRAAK